MPHNHTVMFSAHISGGAPAGTSTVEIYGVARLGQPLARDRLLGTLSLTSASSPTPYADVFKVSYENYDYVYSKVTAVAASQTVVVVMGD
jgi:hypothetical protein